MSAIRRLAAVVGYSHLIEANEAGSLRKRCKPSSEDGATKPIQRMIGRTKNHPLVTFLPSNGNDRSRSARGLDPDR
jgi:hypothetical protein